MTCGFSNPEKTRIRYVLQREWRPHLSPDERDFLQYVIEHSVELGRDVLDVTLDQMINGVPADPVTGWSWRITPVGFARRTLERLIQRLKDKGVLLVEAVRNRCTLIRLNMLWSPVESIMSIAIPKRLQAGSQTRAQTSLPFDDAITATVADIEQEQTAITANLAGNNRHRGGPLDTSNSVRNIPSPSLRSETGFLPEPRKRQRIPAPEKVQDQRLSPAKTPVDTVRAKVAEIEAQSRAHVKAKADKAKNLDAAGAYHTTFVNAWRETYPGVPVPTWTARDMHMVRSVLKSRLHESIEPRHEFLDFVVRNWPRIISLKFGWMKTSPPPQMPTIGFLVANAFIGHFLDAFADRRRVENTKRLPAEEREIEAMIAQGKTRDEALIAVGKRSALSETRAKETEVRRLNGQTIRDAEKRRAALIEEQRRLMRAKAEASGDTPSRPVERFQELGDLTVDLEPLPEIDYSKWN